MSKETTLVGIISTLILKSISKRKALVLMPTFSIFGDILKVLMDGIIINNNID